MKKSRIKTTFRELQRGFWHYVDCWSVNNISAQAAALTYTTILSLVPAIAICIFLFAQVAKLGQIPVPVLGFLLRYLPQDWSNFVLRFANFSEMPQKFKELLLENLAAGTGETVLQYLNTFVSQVDFEAIGLAGFSSVLVTSVLLLFAIENAMNIIWRAPRPKDIFSRVFSYFIALIFAPLLLSISFTLSTVITSLFPKLIVTAWIGSYLTMTMLVLLGFRFFPNAKISWRSALIAALVTALALVLLRVGFGYYTQRSLLYNKFYGGLSALPFFLVWLYFNWTVILAGTQLNYLLQNYRFFKSLGNNRQWNFGPIFARERAQLTFRLVEQLRTRPQTLHDLIRANKMPEFTVTNCLEWMLRSGWIVVHRRRLTKYYQLSKKASNWSLDEEWADILEVDPEKLRSSQVVSVLS